MFSTDRTDCALLLWVNLLDPVWSNVSCHAGASFLYALARPLYFRRSLNKLKGKNQLSQKPGAVSLCCIHCDIISEVWEDNLGKTWRLVRSRKEQTVKVKGKISQDNRAHSYCPKCWSECIQPYASEGREYYRCERCGYDDSRPIMLYPQMRYRILPDGELLHYSVGAVIEWERKILLFLSLIHI